MQNQVLCQLTSQLTKHLQHSYHSHVIWGSASVRFVLVKKSRNHISSIFICLCQITVCVSRPGLVLAWSVLVFSYTCAFCLYFNTHSLPCFMCFLFRSLAPPLHCPPVERLQLSVKSMCLTCSLYIYCCISVMVGLLLPCPPIPESAFCSYSRNQTLVSLF